MSSSSELTLSVTRLASQEFRDRDLVTRHVTCDRHNKYKRWSRVVERFENCHKDYCQDVGIGAVGVRIVVSAPPEDQVRCQILGQQVCF